MVRRISTQDAWAELFARHGIAERLEAEGIAHLDADQIRELREPRLMTKFDARAARPAILREHGCTILPVANGRYALVRGDGYADLPAAPAETVWWSPSALGPLETLSLEISSENDALGLLKESGVLADFTGEDRFVLTARGRERANVFDFGFQGAAGLVGLEAKGVQIELDAGYEGEQVYLFEAKLGAESDFHVRQLYYPYRAFRDGSRATRRTTKPVVPIFLNVANRGFTLVEYAFADPGLYHSLRPVKVRRYCFGEPPPALDFADLLAGVAPDGREPDLPTPQADSLDRVLDAVDAVSQGRLPRDRLALLLGMDARQGAYYGDAGVYAGVLARDGGAPIGYVLTEEGRRLRAETVPERRNARLAAGLLRRPSFHEAARHLIGTGDLPSEAAEEILARHAPTPLAPSTLRRRALTLRSWTRRLAALSYARP